MKVDGDVSWDVYFFRVWVIGSKVGWSFVGLCCDVW